MDRFPNDDLVEVNEADSFLAQAGPDLDPLDGQVEFLAQAGPPPIVAQAGPPSAQRIFPPLAQAGPPLILAQAGPPSAEILLPQSGAPFSEMISQSAPQNAQAGNVLPNNNSVPKTSYAGLQMKVKPKPRVENPSHPDVVIRIIEHWRPMIKARVQYENADGVELERNILRSGTQRSSTWTKTCRNLERGLSKQEVERILEFCRTNKMFEKKFWRPLAQNLANDIDLGPRARMAMGKIRTMVMVKTKDFEHVVDWVTEALPKPVIELQKLMEDLLKEKETYEDTNNLIYGARRHEAKDNDDIDAGPFDDDGLKIDKPDSLKAGKKPRKATPKKPKKSGLLSFLKSKGKD